MIHLSKSLSYYKRSDVRENMANAAANKEIAARYNDRFGKRPEVINHPADILEMAKNGATSFHISEERWRNPLLLRTEMNRRELDELRIGWDLILDVDCENFRISKLITHMIIEMLKEHGLKNISLKFSGNKGFHIGVPFEAFPERVGNVNTKDWFPEGPRRIAQYLIERLKTRIVVEGDYVNFGGYDKIKKETLQLLSKSEELFETEGVIQRLIPEAIMKLDTILIAPRHLYRMPYSLHEKSGLVSIPIELNELLGFDKEKANPDNISTTKQFLQGKVESGEARKLFIQAIEYSPKLPVAEKELEKEYQIPEEAIPEKFFPPCILKLLGGLEDGKKRGLFILINFFSSAGWDYESIEKKLNEWNSKNKDPLHPTYLNTQLKYHKSQKKKMPPPNCDNPAYYSDLRIKCEESICSRVKNPIIFAKKAASNIEKKKTKAK